MLIMASPVQDSDEFLAPVSTGMRILASRSFTIEPSYRGSVLLHSGCVYSL